MNLFELTESLNHDGPKLLEGAIVVPAVRTTLQDLITLTPATTPWVLGGALAVGVYGKSRTTMDIDILLQEDRHADELALAAQEKFLPPEINNMKHRDTGVKVDFLTSTTIAMPARLIDAAFDDAETHMLAGSTVKVLSARWLVIFKLARFSRQDQADIETLIRNCGLARLEGIGLPESWLDRYQEIASEFPQ